jgi:vancomycin permeability regulator SanA
MNKALSFFVLSVTALVGVVALYYRILDQNEPVNKVPGNCVVLVLGYPTEDDGSLSSVQRVRVEAGVMAYRARNCQKLVLSGGAVANQYIEAERMASFAQELGVAKDHIVVEGRSRNTWENIGCSLSYLQKADSITIVSDSLHAKRAKRYLCKQQPFLCGQVDILGSQLYWKIIGWKVLAVLYEFAAGARDLLFYKRDEDYPDACAV